ncbi:MAG: UbiD family decarboxylase, partial [Cohaesibacter sp.]|nr:UbiD family decarboxylase [Cohaesibacter sp.]
MQSKPWLDLDHSSSLATSPLSRISIKESAMFHRTKPVFATLQDFLDYCQSQNALKVIETPISMHLEATELQRRFLEQKGPVLLLKNPILANGQPSKIPVILNLFGTIDRVAWGLGCNPQDLKKFGDFLAFLRQPAPPERSELIQSATSLLKAAYALKGKLQKTAACQHTILTSDEIDLTQWPIQGCWPEEPAPLITWPIVITRPPTAREKEGLDSKDSCTKQSIKSYNWGIYRIQSVGKNKAIMRWLAHRGGAAHHLQWQKLNKGKGRDMPVAIAIGADPATILGAVTPVPETLSEAQFSGLYRGKPTALTKAITQDLLVPANAEIIIEGTISATERLPEGPYGDHTGYYNSVEPFPLLTITAITHRKNPLYLSTFTGRAPDEPSILSEALNDVFLPLIQQTFPEVVDCWLPPEAASYRIAVLSIDKRYPGQARRIMMGLWSMLPQFNYTKLIIVVDKHINARNWQDIMWAVATKADPSRDLLTIADTPIDYLDFASPKEGLGGD